MRIAYTCHDSFPSAGTNTQQTFWTLVEVARLGVSIQLIVPLVEHQPGRDPRAAVARHYGLPPDQLPANLRIVALGRQPTEGWMQQGWFDWGLGGRLHGARAAALSEPHDLIWTRDPLALVSCLRAGLPTLFETYRPDFATRTRFALWRRLCLSSPHLRGIVAHSRLAADAYVAAGVPAAGVLVAHNGFAPSLLEPRLTRAAARAQLALPPDGPLVVYAGQAGPKKGVDAIIGLAAAVPSACTVIVGAAPESVEGRRLMDVACQAGARNVLLRPRVAPADVSAYLYSADCLLIPPTDEPLRRFRRTVLPMKVFMYLAAGRPILAPRLPDIEEVLTDGETARLVPPNDVTQAAAALTTLLSDAALQERLSNNALAAGASYTWAARARRLVAFIEQGA